jgi:hypothetical protein
LSLTVACVEWGNYLGRGEEYVEKLRAGVGRWLQLSHEFVCVRPEGELQGWWNKIELFRPGRFTGRVLYLDLDSVIVGQLDELAISPGIVYLKDWGWKKHVYGSGTMVWDAGDHEDIFRRFSPMVSEWFAGDQDWMTHLGGWAPLPAHLCRSYRYHCKDRPPADCSVVAFHGQPKPHEVGGWVAEAWR